MKDSNIIQFPVHEKEYKRRLSKLQPGAIKFQQSGIISPMYPQGVVVSMGCLEPFLDMRESIIYEEE